jgi:sterol desaturase/sphingolipid hydroxylase (fatty acid hydroxylase superfamily)
MEQTVALMVKAMLSKGSLQVSGIGFLLIGLFIYWRLPRNRSDRSPRGLFRYLIPAALYGHRSAKIDYWILPLTIASASVVSATGLAAQFFVSNSIQAQLSGLLGVRTAIVENFRWTIALQFLILFLTADLMQYVQHYLFHKIPLLWRLHRAHHSAEVLTPVTRWRFHPLETLIEAIITGPGSGILSGSLLYLCGMKATGAAMTIVVATRLALQVTYYFRHSHVWISYGTVLSHFFYSPCMHQIHHSALPHHRDKNLGSLLSVWDYLFGTLYVPRHREEFLLGLSVDEVHDRNPHPNAVALLIEPLVTAARMVRPRLWTSRDA